MKYATMLMPGGHRKGPRTLRAFALLFATADNTRPTPDGGPWVCEYEAPSDDLERCARNAERILWGAVAKRAPKAFRKAVALGWAEPNACATPKEDDRG